MRVSDRAPLFSPHGTARRRFAGLGYGAADAQPADSLEELFAHLNTGLRAHDFGDEHLYLAEELTRMHDTEDARQQRALALLVLASMISVNQGSTRIPMGDGDDGPLHDLVAGLLRDARLPDDPAALVADMRRLITSAAPADRIIAPEGEYRPLVVADGCVYQQRMLRAEDALVQRIGARAAQAPDAASEADPSVQAAYDTVHRASAYSGDRPVVLSTEQAGAVKHASTHALTIVTGGPGTGKTAIVVSILRLLHRLGTPAEEIALAGPTGKAANRMAMSVHGGLASVRDRDLFDAALLARCPAPQTLHRLLGYMPSSGGFRHHENNPLAASLVIVDEASMIDLELMDRLLRATSPRARLVLLGDADQLPSVDAGAVFRDLVTALPEHTVRLTHSYRMNPDDPAGSHILQVAAEIGRGESPLPLAPAAAGGVELFDTGADPAAIAGFVDEWARARYADHSEFARLAGLTYRFRAGVFDERDREALAALFAHHEKSRLLTVTRRFAAGSDAVNARVHDRVVPAGEPRSRANNDPLPGEPLLMLRNDYDRGLFNGDQGVAARVSEDGAPPQLRAVFPRRGALAPFHLDPLRPSLDLAYALTVHKSQGSEFEGLVVILPTVDVPLLSRELLYTAVTRARSSVVIAGTEAGMRAAVSRTVERFSGVADKLSVFA